MAGVFALIRSPQTEISNEALVPATGRCAIARDDQPITILLASFQGAAFIDTQLESIAEQTFENWRLLVSDDGSRDGTRDIVARFARRHQPGRVELIDGPGRGATQNFLHLLGRAPQDQMLAFCDQDDRWFPDKLARAADALAQRHGPAHYAARTIIANHDLTPIAGSRSFARPFAFRNALVQACMAGNTSVFNVAAARLLRAGAIEASRAGVESHDWWAYQLCAGAGAGLIHDPRPALLYRQHTRSEMGRNDTPGAMAKRFGMLFAGRYGAWLAANVRALTPMRDQLTPDSRDVLDRFSEALHMPGPLAALAMRRLGLYRHGRAGTTALYSAALAGRLRQPRSPRIPSR